MTAELRGLSVVSDTVAWASGAKGTVLRTVDGAHWQAIRVADADKLDFRDIHAIDAKSALVMSAGPGPLSRIYRTDDGGASWRLLATNQFDEGFWDAMAFWDADNGIVFGDPVKGRFQAYGRPMAAPPGASSMARDSTRWRRRAPSPPAAPACRWPARATPGSSPAARSRRAYSIRRTAAPPGKLQSCRFRPALRRAARSRSASTTRASAWPPAATTRSRRWQAVNGARTEDGGATWIPATILPAGYMSVVMPVPGTSATFVAAGLAGSGSSLDAGKSWTALDPHGGQHGRLRVAGHRMGDRASRAC